MDDEFTRQLEAAKKYFDQLKKALSQARRKGLDTRMAELEIMEIPSKIKYAEVSGKPDDLKKLRALLAKAALELPREKAENSE